MSVIITILKELSKANLIRTCGIFFLFDKNEALFHTNHMYFTLGV